MSSITAALRSTCALSAGAFVAMAVLYVRSCVGETTNGAAADGPSKHRLFRRAPRCPLPHPRRRERRDRRSTAFELRPRTLAGTHANPGGGWLGLARLCTIAAERAARPMGGVMDRPEIRMR